MKYFCKNKFQDKYNHIIFNYQSLVHNKYYVIKILIIVLNSRKTSLICD